MCPFPTPQGGPLPLLPNLLVTDTIDTDPSTVTNWARADPSGSVTLTAACAIRLLTGATSDEGSAITRSEMVWIAVSPPEPPVNPT